MLTDLLRDYRINRQTAYNLKSNLEKADVYIYTALSGDDCERIGFKKITDLNMIKELAGSSESVGIVNHPADIFVKQI